MKFYGRSILVQLLSFCLLLFNIQSSAQKENALANQISFRSSKTFSDHNSESSNPDKAIQLIDSIALTKTTAGYFCKAYSNSMHNISKQAKELDSGARVFIEKFEISFANYFLNAFFAWKMGNLSPASEWKCYFSIDNAHSWQFVLMGVNAHINCDMWKGLVDNFNRQEIFRYKKDFLAMQSSIVKVYNEVFDTIRSNNSKLRFMNFITLGLAKKFGERLFYKWRKRNVKLAILYFNNRQKFENKFALVTRKKNNIDKRILKYKQG